MAIWEVISPAVEGEYSFNLQIRTAELLPGEEETLKLSIYLNETLLKEDTDFSYSFTGVFSVWIPESFIFFADPLHHFSLQLSPTPLSYGEASVLTVTARDASNSEIALVGSKTLTLRVFPEDFFSFISAVGDTIGPEMTGVAYRVARSGAIKLIPYGLIPDTLSVFGIVSAELEENTSKTGQLEFDADMPCVETNLSTTSARPSDTVTVSFSYTRTDGFPGSFRPDQQFRVFIADNDSMGLLYSEDGQVGPDLFGALQPIYYVAPDSLSGDSIVVQFLVEPVVSGGAAAAAPVEGPTMGKSSAGARSNAFQMLALSGCTTAQLVVTTDDLDHFLVTLEKDTVAFTELSKIFVQAKNADNEDITLDPSTLLKFDLAGESVYGTFIKPNGDTVKTFPVVLTDVRYDDARSGKVIFAAVAANPSTSAKPLITVSLQNDETRRGEREIVVVERRLKIVMIGPTEVRPLIPEELITLPGNQGKIIPARAVTVLRIRLTRNGVEETSHPYKISSDYVDLSGGHDHVAPRRTLNLDNYGSFARQQGGQAKNPLDESTASGEAGNLTYVASRFGDRMLFKAESRTNPLLWDTLGIVEKVSGLVNFADTSAQYWILTGNVGVTMYGGCAGTVIQHASNHYGSSIAVKSLQAAIRDFFDWSGSPADEGGYGAHLLLGINDMSLENGGLFDICSTWETGHYYHRTGASVDISGNATRYNTPGGPVNLKSALPNGITIVDVLTNIMGRHGGGQYPEEPIHYGFGGH